MKKIDLALVRVWLVVILALTVAFAAAAWGIDQAIQEIGDDI